MEDQLFAGALGTMDVWYCHPNTTVLSLTTLPENYFDPSAGYFSAEGAAQANAEACQYHNRGW